MRRVPLLAVLTVGMHAGHLQAQSVETRTRIDSLLTIRERGDTPAASACSASTTSASDEEKLVCAYARLSGHDWESGQRSLNDFYELAIHHRDWPYAWLGLGTTKLQLDRNGVPEIRSPHQIAGTGWRSGALQAFQVALQRAPSLGWALGGVTDVLLLEPLGPTKDRAEALLQRYSPARPTDPRAALALALAADAKDSFGPAEQYVEDFLASGGDSAIADWELAQLRFAAGDPAAGASHYYAAIAHGAVIRQRLRDDLAFVATPAELARFDSCPPVERVEWVRRFWSSREVTAGRAPGSRLREHFRRVRYARKHFPVTTTRSLVSFHRAYFDAPPGLDDRAVIYIRQGEPDTRATYLGGEGTPPNESWAYFRPEGDLAFHFYADLGGAFRLADGLSSVLCAVQRECDPAAAVYESRAGLGQYYLSMANRLELESSRTQGGRNRLEAHQVMTPELAAAERRRTLADVHTGTTTDADPLDLERSWEPVVQAYGIVDPVTGSTGALVVASLPVPRDLDSVSLANGAVGYLLHLRATGVNGQGEVVLDSSTVQRLRTPRPLSHGESLTLVASFPLPAGAQRLRVVIADTNETRGAVRIVPDLPVVGLFGDSLVLSDVIAGRVGSAVTWRRPDGELIELNPGNLWHSDDQMSLAFDVGGLHPGSSYRLQTGIADLGADSTTPPRTAVESDEQANTSHVFISRALNLRALRPGRYLLTVTVTSDGRRVRRERRITIAAAR